MGINFTDIAVTDPIIAATLNDRLDQLDAAIEAGLGGVTLTNKSGGSLAANDCVVVSTANDEAVKTTTSAGDTARPGIVLAGGAADAEVTVTFLGEVTVVVSAAGTRGQWIKTATVAKRVTPTSTLDVGVFGILTANSTGGAGTTAKALLLGTVITAPGAHTHAATDIVSGLLALARGGSGADLSATGPGYLKQASGGAVVTVSAIASADLPAATETAQGAAELATTAEAQAGADTGRVLTPAAAAAAFYLKSVFLNTSAGAGDAGKPIVLDGGGKIDATMLEASDINHNGLSGLTTGDPHTQYQLRSALTTKGDIYARTASDIARLAAGASGQVLSADPAEPTGLKWIPPVSPGAGIPASTVDAKGDLLAGTADDTVARLAVGSNGQVLMANSAQATGLEWAYLLQDNIFINGGFDVWQRTTDDTGVTTTRKYVADRWGVLTGAGTLAHVQRSTTLRTGARSKYALQLDGAAGVTTVDVSQRIEAAMTGLYKQVVVFSCYVYNGSGADFTPTLFASTPGGADDWSSPTVRNGGGSGESLQSCTDSAWTLVTWTADISGYTNINNGVEFRLRIPSGSLVAGDAVRLAEFNLVPGSVATPFVGRPIAAEIGLCERYYRKSYNLTVAPGTNTLAGAYQYQTRTAIPGSAAGTLRQGVTYTGRMRIGAAVTIYSTDGVANAISNVTGSNVRTGVTAAGLGETGFLQMDVSDVDADAIAADNILRFHWGADAEL